MKRKLATLLGVLMLLSLFASCTKEKDEDDVKSSAETVGKVGESQFNEPGTFPILKEETTLSMLVVSSPNVIDYEDNKMTRLVKERTNINLEFHMLPSEDSAEKLAIMVNAGDDLPDILNLGIIDATLLHYGTQGAIIPLNDYYENSAHFINEAGEGYLSKLPLVTSSDGNIYTIPYVQPIIGNQFSRKAWINERWLDKFDLEVPQTTDELYIALKTFLEEDANGNGKRDEIPFQGNKGWSQNVQAYLMNAFVYCNADTQYLIPDDNGTLGVAYATEEWRQGLEYMNKLVTEGLLTPLSFTNDSSQGKALMLADGDITGGFAGNRPQYEINDMRKLDFVPLPPLKGPNGEGVSASAVEAVRPGAAWQISSNCENPEAAFKLGDWMISEEFSMFQRYGEKGVDWKEIDAEPIFPGAKYVIEQILEWGSPQSSHWAVGNPKYLGDFLVTEGWSGTIEPENPNYYIVAIAQSLPPYQAAVPSNEIIKIIYTEDEMDQIVDIQTTLKLYAEESMVGFITGNKSFSEWDSYLQELKTIGVDTFVEISQTAYDRTMGY